MSDFVQNSWFLFSNLVSLLSASVWPVLRTDRSSGDPCV